MGWMIAEMGWTEKKYDRMESEGQGTGSKRRGIEGKCDRVLRKFDMTEEKFAWMEAEIQGLSFFSLFSSNWACDTSRYSLRLSRVMVCISCLPDSTLLKLIPDSSSACS